MDITTENSSKRARIEDNDNEENAEEAFMIPGVEGKMQFAFPPKIVTILRYVEFFDLASAAGAVTTQVMSMNSVFDPDVTGVGHQPLYRDAYASIYTNYRVLGSKLKATFCPVATASDGTQGPWAIGINGAVTSSSLGGGASLRSEFNDTASWIINHQTGDPQRTLFLTYSPEIKLGRPAGDDTVGSTIGASPSQQYFAHVWLADLNSSISSLCTVRIEVHYTVEFFGLIIPSQS